MPIDLRDIKCLFRNILFRFCFCSIARRRETKSRIQCANCLPLTHVIAIEPSNIMLTQAFGNNYHLFIKPVKKESHLAPIAQLEDMNI
ncbi:putative gustatory receptor 59c [Dirofilaria immitis]